MPTVSVHRVIDAPPEEVWAAIADIERAARWNRAWGRIEFRSQQRQGLGTTFRVEAEGGHSAEFEVVAWEPPQLLAFAPLPYPSALHGLSPIAIETQAFYLRPSGDGRTELHLTATATTHGLRGWLWGRLFWPGYQKQGLRRALEAIAALFQPETEETALSDD